MTLVFRVVVWLIGLIYLTVAVPFTWFAWGMSYWGGGPDAFVFELIIYVGLVGFLLLIYWIRPFPPIGIALLIFCAIWQVWYQQAGKPSPLASRRLVTVERSMRPRGPFQFLGDCFLGQAQLIQGQWLRGERTEVLYDESTTVREDTPNGPVIRKTGRTSTVTRER